MKRSKRARHTTISYSIGALAPVTPMEPYSTGAFLKVLLQFGHLSGHRELTRNGVVHTGKSLLTLKISCREGGRRYPKGFSDFLS